MQTFLFRILAQLNVSPLPGASADKSKITDVINVALTILGSVAVLIIVLGGIQYILSRGESNQVSKAKDTILYAVIGLIITMMAGVIVNFVLKGL